MAVSDDRFAWQACACNRCSCLRHQRHAARLAACRVRHRHGCAVAMWPERLDGAARRAVSVNTLFVTPMRWPNPAIWSRPGFQALPGSGGEATCPARRRGFRGISSVAALPAVFHDRETPPVMPACNPTETLPGALRAAPYSLKARRLRIAGFFFNTARGRHVNTNDHRHQHHDDNKHHDAHARALPSHTRRTLQKAGCDGEI